MLSLSNGPYCHITKLTSKSGMSTPTNAASNTPYILNVTPNGLDNCISQKMSSIFSVPDYYVQRYFVNDMLLQ